MLIMNCIFHCKAHGEPGECQNGVKFLIVNTVVHKVPQAEQTLKVDRLFLERP